MKVTHGAEEFSIDIRGQVLDIKKGKELCARIDVSLAQTMVVPPFSHKRVVAILALALMKLDGDSQ